MKAFLSLFLLAGLFGFTVLLAGFGPESPGNSSGAPPGYTGSPHDNKNCSHCMSGTVDSVTGWITSNVPPVGYKNDSVYSIIVSFSGTGNKGFEISPQDIFGNLIGTLYAGVGSQLVGNGVYITHTAAQPQSTASWIFSWKAPSTGSDDIIFYGAMAVTKLHTHVTTMVVKKNTVGINDDIYSGINIYPNPTMGNLKAEFIHLNPGLVTITLTDVFGRTVRRLIEEYFDAGQVVRDFSLDLNPGIYFVRISADNRVLTKKLILL